MDEIKKKSWNTYISYRKNSMLTPDQMISKG